MDAFSFLQTQFPQFHSFHSFYKHKKCLSITTSLIRRELKDSNRIILIYNPLLITREQFISAVSTDLTTLRHINLWSCITCWRACRRSESRPPWAVGFVFLSAYAERYSVWQTAAGSHSHLKGGSTIMRNRWRRYVYTRNSNRSHIYTNLVFLAA